MKILVTDDSQGHVIFAVRTRRGWDEMVLSPEQTHGLIVQLAKAYNKVTGCLPPPVSRRDIMLFVPFTAAKKKRKKN